jgi:hypothetical protein
MGEVLCGSGSSCQTVRLTAESEGYTDGPSFCTAAATSSFPDLSSVSGSYQIMAKGLNWFSSNPSKPAGAADDLPGANFGLFYNAQDQDNFDFFYVRIDNGDYCIQAGYTVDGVATYYENDFESASGKCPQTTLSEGSLDGSSPILEAQQWYDLSVDVVAGEKAVIKINSGTALSVEPHFALSRGAGMLVAQGSHDWEMTDTAYFKDFHMHALHGWKLDPIVQHCSEDSKPTEADSDILCDTVKVLPGHTGFTDIHKCTVLKMHGTGTTGDFCSTIPGHALPFDGPYDMTANALNWKSGSGDTLSDDGKLGVFYNAVDGDNYDFVFFRPHDDANCYQTGYVEGGVIKYYGDDAATGSGICPGGYPTAQEWFTIDVNVMTMTGANGMASIKLNNALVALVSTHFPVSPKGGALIKNGHSNVGYFQDFQIKATEPMTHKSQRQCTHMSCKDELTDGHRHIKVYHSNWEEKGVKHVCKARAANHGSLGRALALIGTWQFSDSWHRPCECMCNF